MGEVAISGPIEFNAQRRWRSCNPWTRKCIVATRMSEGLPSSPRIHLLESFSQPTKTSNEVHQDLLSPKERGFALWIPAMQEEIHTASFLPFAVLASHLRPHIYCRRCGMNLTCRLIVPSHERNHDPTRGSVDGGPHKLVLGSPVPRLAKNPVNLGIGMCGRNGGGHVRQQNPSHT